MRTVLSEMPRSAPISVSERSWKYRSTTTVRIRMGSCCSARTNWPLLSTCQYSSPRAARSGPSA
ncbi:hypothetical protein ASD08_43600 [Streptomyces sp. Root369]|nr:hypothetical protein ASD08_43600 [Streptomyces sp. Root369]